MSHTSENMVSQRNDAVEVIRKARPDFSPRVAIILGTGLGGLTEHLQNSTVLDYAQIPNLAQPTVMEHEGKLWLAELENVPVMVFQGRFHFYEGYSLEQVTFPVRIAQGMGCHTLIVSNVAGALNPQFHAGELVAITDHLNLLGTSPLVGRNHAELGPRFPDMMEPYSAKLLQSVQSVALQAQIPLHRGVYACMSGPQMETRAEYRMLRVLGADMIGMSTVPEVIVAVHAGFDVLGLTVLTDECFPDALKPVSIPNIMAHAKNAEPRLVALVRGVLKNNQWAMGS